MARKFLGFILFLLLALVACSGEDAPATVSGASRSNSSDSTTQHNTTDSEPQSTNNNPASSSNTVTLANLPMPRPDEMVLPELDISSPIAFSHDNRLYVAHFDGQEATLLADTLEFTITAKDDGQLIYTALGSESPTNVFDRYVSIYFYDAEADGIINEIPLPDDDQFIMVDDWSPDGQWVLLNRFERNAQIIDLVSMSHSTPVETFTSLAASAWLSDNTLVLFIAGDDDGIASVERYDPATDTYLDIDLDLSVLTSDNSFAMNYALLSEQLAANDLSLAITHDDSGQTVLDPSTNTFVSIIAPQDQQSNAGFCEEWTIETGSPATETATLYMATETHALTDLHLLPDGSSVFLRWFKADCDFSEPLQADIIHLFPDGENDVVARDLYVNVQSVRVFFGAVQQRMDVSADGRYLVWISQEELTRGDVALNLTDLTTGDGAVLLITPESDGVLFRTVVWVD